MNPIEQRLREEQPEDPVYRPGRVEARLATEIAPERAGVWPRMGTPLFRALAVATTAAAAVMLVVGFVLVRNELLVQPNGQREVLARVQEEGVLRVAVSPDHPQLQIANGGLTGFDIDIAQELARRLGVRLQLEIMPAETMLSTAEAGKWDIAMPSLPTEGVDASRFAASAPYYFWPHYLLVEASSGLTSLDDLAEQPICAVTGDAGEAWLRGQSDAGHVTGRVVARASDDECLAALDSGDVAAVVTATLGPADVAMRPSLRSIMGPPVEPRVIAASLADNPGPLVTKVNSIINDLARDGTLARLSRSRFGGSDLTKAPSP